MFNKIINYFESSYIEMRKVTWPTRKEVTSHSIIVVSSIIVGTAIVALLDLGLFQLLEKFIVNR